VGGDRLLSHTHTLHTSLVSAPIINLGHKDRGSAVVTKDETQSKTRWSGGTDVKRWRGGIGVLSFPDPSSEWNIISSTGRIPCSEAKSCPNNSTHTPQFIKAEHKFPY